MVAETSAEVVIVPFGARRCVAVGVGGAPIEVAVGDFGAAVEVEVTVQRRLDVPDFGRLTGSGNGWCDERGPVHVDALMCTVGDIRVTGRAVHGDTGGFATEIARGPERVERAAGLVEH